HGVLAGVAPAAFRARDEPARDRRGDHRQQRQTAEHEKACNDLPGGLIRDDVAVTNRRDGLYRPPDSEPHRVERLGVDEPFDDAEDDHGDSPKAADQIGGVARAQAPAREAAVDPPLGSLYG